jgi:lariat debranching enzyme
LEALECPQKYKELGQFHKFYNGDKIAPILTLFVGGNHEASNLLRDLYYGGWVSQNIYYLGASGVVNVVKGD